MTGVSGISSLPAPLLIIMAGLPGSGKSTIARELAAQTGAIWLRIDSLEDAIRRSHMPLGQDDVADAGYLGCAALAVDNLRLGRVVIVDSVNPIPLTRDLWHDAADEAGVGFVDLEIRCSDAAEHRHRVETRTALRPGYKLPSWQDVLDREYHEFAGDRLVQIDTAGRDLDDCVTEARAKITRICQASIPAE